MLKVVRIGLKTLGIIAGALLALILIWFAINLVDEDLKPATQALIASPSNPYAPEDNIYVALVGFDAPSNRSVIEDGSARIADFNRALDSMQADPDKALAYLQKSDLNKLEFRGDLSSWSLLTSSIWSSTKAHHDQVAALVKANQELYLRYISLHARHGYFETARPSPMAPIGHVPTAARILFLADVANRVQTGTKKERYAALSDLKEDLLLWRAVLRGNGTLVSKMIACVNLHGDLLLIGDMITDPQTELMPFDSEAASLVSPFSIADWSLGDVFVAEMRVSDSLYREIVQQKYTPRQLADREATWWNRTYNAIGLQFFKLHATENLEAEFIEKRRELADADPGEFSRAHLAYEAWLEQRISFTSPRTLYNPMGKVLVWIGNSGEYEDYILRAYDIAAMQRLVCLAYQIRRQNVRASAVPIFMSQHTEWATHPVNRVPFRWDGEARTLTALPTGKQPSDRRFSLQLPIS